MAWTDELKKIKEENTNRIYNEKRSIQEKHDSLSPMVKKLLTELGDAIWGRGILGFKYKFENSDNGWEIKRRNSSNHYIHVNHDYGENSVSQFYISGGQPSDFDGFGGYSEWIYSRDFSEQALKDALLELCNSLQWYPRY
jgi:hypothetical protein